MRLKYTYNTATTTLIKKVIYYKNKALTRKDFM